MYKKIDPIADANCYYDDLEEALDRRRKCCCCGEPIQEDKAVEMDGEMFCEECEYENIRELWDKARQDYLAEVEQW